MAEGNNLASCGSDRRGYPIEEISQLYDTPGPIVPLTIFNCGGTSPEHIVNVVGVVPPSTWDSYSYCVAIF